MVLHFGIFAKIIDVETAFLYGDLELKICMECHQGIFKIGKYDYIILNKFIYDLVLAARQYYNKQSRS